MVSHLKFEKIEFHTRTHKRDFCFENTQKFSLINLHYNSYWLMLLYMPTTLTTFLS